MSEHTTNGNGKRPLTVKYFAVLRDATGVTEEELRTTARTPADLFAGLRDRYGIDLDPDQLQVAVNHELSTWDAPLEEEDTVAFLPPVAGG